MSEARQEGADPAAVDPNAADPAGAPDAGEGQKPEPDQGSAEPSPEPKPDAGYSPLEKRMFELRSKAREAEARAAAAERALAAIEAAKAEPKPEPPPTELVRPERAQFDTPEEYEAALTEWASERAVRRAMAEFQKQDAERRQRTEREAAEEKTREEVKRVSTEWEKRRGEFAAQVPDYEEVAEAEDVPISEAMGRAILTSEDGPAIAYYLGKNPEEAKRIAAMVVPGAVYPRGHQFAGYPVADFQRQLFEMGKISAKIAAEAASGAKKPSAAPNPIKPVRPSGAATRKTLDELAQDPEAYARDFAERQKQRANAR